MGPRSDFFIQTLLTLLEPPESSSPIITSMCVLPLEDLDLEELLLLPLDIEARREHKMWTVLDYLYDRVSFHFPGSRKTKIKILVHLAGFWGTQCCSHCYYIDAQLGTHPRNMRSPDL